MRIKTAADTGAYLGTCLFSPPGRTDPADLAVRNSLFKKLVMQQGSLTARQTTVCTRQPAEPPVYLPCLISDSMAAGWKEATQPSDATTDNVMRAGTDDLRPIFPSIIDTTIFTLEWFTHTRAASTNTNVYLRWYNDTALGHIDVTGNLSTAGNWLLDYSDDSGNAENTYTPSIDLTGYHHHCFICDGSAYFIFIDGVLQGSAGKTRGVCTFPAYGTTYIQIELTQLDTQPNDAYLHLPRFSQTIRYSTGGFNPPERYTDDADTTWLWEFHEGPATQYADAHAGQLIYPQGMNPPPALYPGYVRLIGQASP